MIRTVQSKEKNVLFRLCLAVSQTLNFVFSIFTKMLCILEFRCMYFSPRASIGIGTVLIRKLRKMNVGRIAIFEEVLIFDKKNELPLFEITENLT